MHAQIFATASVSEVHLNPCVWEQRSVVFCSYREASCNKCSYFFSFSRSLDAARLIVFMFRCSTDAPPASLVLNRKENVFKVKVDVVPDLEERVRTMRHLINKIIFNSLILSSVTISLSILCFDGRLLLITENLI